MSSNDEKQWYAQATQVEVPAIQYVKELGWAKRIVQGAIRLLAPTTSLAFTRKDEYFRRTFAGQVGEYSRVRKNIKQLYLVYRSRRISQLNEIVDRLGLGETPEQWDDEVDHVPHFLQQDGKTLPSKLAVSSLVNNTREYQVINAVPSVESLAHAQKHISEQDIRLLDEYCASIERTRVLRAHLQEVEEDLSSYAHMVHTQATAELTYFRGLRDWCKVMSQLTDGLAAALIGISTLGAGLVYSTIFGATRGDVGLMCYCFPFFSLGFLLPVIIQILLHWGASLHREVKFASQPFWTIVIGLFMGISAMAVMASLTILNVTILTLKPDSEATLPDPASTPVAGIITFSITGSIFVLILIGTVLSAIAAKAFTTLSGMRAVVSAMYGSQGGQEDALKIWLPV